MSKCSGCPYSSNGSSNAFSDAFDSCRREPNTGFGGFNDNSKSDDDDDE